MTMNMEFGNEALWITLKRSYTIMMLHKPMTISERHKKDPENLSKHIPE